MRNRLYIKSNAFPFLILFFLLLVYMEEYVCGIQIFVVGHTHMCPGAMEQFWMSCPMIFCFILLRETLTIPSETCSQQDHSRLVATPTFLGLQVRAWLCLFLM